MTETLANGYSSDSTQRELSYEYPDDLVRMIFIVFCILVHLKKVTLASEGLIYLLQSVMPFAYTTEKLGMVKMMLLSLYIHEPFHIRQTLIKFSSKEILKVNESK